jgi:DNA end-binding protein Ku
MARSFWKGVISFGLVAIPVKMYVATESQTPGFHLLHKKCLTRPKQVLHCEQDDEYFTLKDTVRGYEYAKDQYIVFQESELEKIPVRTSHTIEIHGFIDSKEIDPIYYQASHYLEPEELGVKPFALLIGALLKTKRVGIAKVTFQRREHLCCLRPLDDIMVLHTMHYHDEILPRNELVPPKPALKKDELDLAVSLVTTMARTFKPEEYEDKYRVALKAVIEARLKGKEIALPEAPKVEIPDLMSALKASIESAVKRSSERKAVAAGREKE